MLCPKWIDAFFNATKATEGTIKPNGDMNPCKKTIINIWPLVSLVCAIFLLNFIGKMFDVQRLFKIYILY